MTDVALSGAPPRATPITLWEKWRKGLFGTKLNTALTAAFVSLLLWAVPPLLRWAVIDATWIGTAEACAATEGACWAFIGAKLRFILFAFYPPAEHWRPFLATALLLGLFALSAMPRFWCRRLGLAWILVFALVTALMGGIGSGRPVSTSQWGGLPLTLLLSLVSFAGAFPLAVLLALGRRSAFGGLRLLCIAFIEIARGVPMIAVLYTAMLLLPMMLPTGWSIDKLVRVQMAMVLFFSAYLAEILRAGLQAVPHGQWETARSLGLGYWQATWLVVMPQVLRSVVPALVTLGIGIVQSTSLVAVIGIFDFLNAARTSANDPQWLGFYDEAFVFAALLYFGLCFWASRYSLWLEQRLAVPR
jgi:general L-amino acid transport system permease protein